jgi:hypothetical protein
MKAVALIRLTSGNATWTDTMSKQPKRMRKFAVCVSNAGYEASLERNKIYVLLPDADAAEDGDVRVVDESGEDYLYPAGWFVPIDVPKAVESALLKAS